MEQTIANELEPCAWRVLRPGGEYDYLVFANQLEAQDAADEINSTEENEGSPYRTVVESLFAIKKGA